MLRLADAGLSFENWGERIEIIMDLECSFELGDEYNAGNWRTCAVGERDSTMLSLLKDNYHQDRVAQLLDPYVVFLGNQFANAIGNNNKEKALELYNEIINIPEEKFYKKNAKFIEEFFQLTESRIGTHGMRMPVG